MNKLMLNPLRAAVLLSLVAAGQAQANQLEEIVVTAQKRSESLAEVPISISVVTGTQIEDQGLANLEALSFSIPNLKISQTSIANRIAIRGIASGDNKGFEQSVAMFVDGIYYGRDQLSRMPLVDLQRVEVLKGPQPTLFGKNAIAGAVSVISRQPSDEFEASVDALYEVEHEEMVLTGLVSGPVNDALGLRLVARYRGMDGYFDNTTQERMEPNVEESFVRGTMTWQSGDVTGSLKLENANFDVEGQPRETFNPVGTYSLIFQGPLFVDTVEDYKRQDNGYESQNQVTNAVLTLEMPLGENTLTSISGFLEYEVDELIDVDFSRLNLLDGTNQQEEYRQYSQELRITSPDGGDFNYITGLYLQRSELTADDTVVFNPFFFAFGLPFAALGNTFNVRDYEQESSLWSVFAQAEWALTDNARFTLGARYNNESKKGSRNLAVVKGPLNPYPDFLVAAVFRALNIEAHNISGQLDDSSFDPVADLKVNLTDDLMVYARYAQGSKAAGFDIRSNSLPDSTTVARPGAFQFAGEDAKSVEGGIRYNRENLSLNFSVYRTEYDNLQVNIFDGTLNFNVRNAASAITQGFEADGRWAINENFTLSGAVAYLDFEFDDFEQGQCYYQQVPGPGGFCDYSGKSNALTPEWTGNLGLDYRMPFGAGLVFGAGVTADFSSSFIGAANLDPRTEQESFTKLGARVSVGSDDGRWEVALIGRNLSDERILQVVGAMPLATTITQGTGIAYTGIYDRPRTLALALRYRW